MSQAKNNASKTLAFTYLSVPKPLHEPITGVTLQSLKETSEVLVFPRVLSQAEQAKVLEACRQAAVLVDLDMLPGSTSISLMGVAGRVSKVSPFMQDSPYMLCAQCMGEATTTQAWARPNNNNNIHLLYNIQRLQYRVALSDLSCRLWRCVLVRHCAAYSVSGFVCIHEDGYVTQRVCMRLTPEESPTCALCHEHASLLTRQASSVGLQ